MKIKNLRKKKIFISLIVLLLKIYYMLLRRELTGRKHVDDLIHKSIPIVFVIWHGRQFWVYKTFQKDNCTVMSSTSSDGKLQAAVLKKFGFNIVWGSSNKSPARALLGAVKQMQKGANCLMAVDGPKGPVYKVKPGAIFAAKKLNAHIIPVAFAADRYWTLKAWDQYILPKPFSRSCILFGDSFQIPQDIQNENLDVYCEMIEMKLNRLVKQAETMAREK